MPFLTDPNVDVRAHIPHGEKLDRSVLRPQNFFVVTGLASRATLSRRRKAGLLPNRTIGGKRFWSIDEVERAVSPVRDGDVDLATWVRARVDEAPPLTEEQADLLAREFAAALRERVAS